MENLLLWGWREACGALHISRSLLYKLIAEGSIRA